MRQPEIDTRKGSIALVVILLVAAIALTTLFFREGVAGPLKRTRSVFLAVTTPVMGFGDAITAPVRGIGDWFGGLAVSRSEVEALRRQNQELRGKLARYEEAVAENARLAGLLKLSQAAKQPAVAAHIIGRPTSNWEGSAVVDKGTAEGIRIAMPVVAAQGLVGQVVEVAPHSAQIRLITDRRSGVAGIIQASRAPGIVKGSIEGVLNMDFVSREASPRVGDVVITSGIGGVYPKGLVVGDITEVTDERDKPYPRLVVTSRVPIVDIEEVLILTGPMPEAQVGE
jgi:rod shape-determining protein MreC